MEILDDGPNEPAPRAFAAIRAAGARVVVAAGRRGAPLSRADRSSPTRRADPGWSFSGTGEPIANRGGVVGAWLSDLLLYLFGLSAWWWVVAGVVLVVAGYRRVVRPEHASDHPLRARRRRLRAGAAVERGARSDPALSKLPAALPLAPGGALGESIGQACARRRLQRRDAAAARAVRRRHVAALRHVVAARDGAHRRRRRDAVRARMRARREEAHRPSHRRRARGRARAGRRAPARGHRRSASRSSSCPPATAVPKSERVVQREAAAALHRHARFAAAAAVAARGCAAGAPRRSAPRRSSSRRA